MFNVGKFASKAVAKKAASVPAKKQNEMMVRGGTKYMGDVEEVKPLRLAGPEAAKKPGVSKAAIAAGVAAGAGATALALRGKEDKAETAKPASRVAASAAAPSTRLRDMDIRDTAVSKSEKAPSFSAAFKAARAAGKDVFTYEGKRYTTEMAGESKAKKTVAAPSKMEERGVREGRNENIDEDTRKRAMESVANLAKGGAVMKKKPAMKKAMPFAKGGAVKKKGC